MPEIGDDRISRFPEACGKLCVWRLFRPREARFGKGLLDVGQAAFGGCSNLLHVYFGGDAPEPRGTRIYVRTPTNLVNHVNAAAKGWADRWPPKDDFSRAVLPMP